LLSPSRRKLIQKYLSLQKYRYSAPSPSPYCNSVQIAVETPLLKARRCRLPSK
ncbi:hypothetical protein PIB30_047361, partial [Stylosanthes scabra]|nr:hypothetical protein [Stylosanthes scabra]